MSKPLKALTSYALKGFPEPDSQLEGASEEAGICSRNLFTVPGVRRTNWVLSNEHVLVAYEDIRNLLSAAWKASGAITILFTTPTIPVHAKAGTGCIVAPNIFALKRNFVERSDRQNIKKRANTSPNEKTRANCVIYEFST